LRAVRPPGWTVRWRAVRQALIEARRSGIHVFCITIDSEARE
jgi:hypothetical protein